MNLKRLAILIALGLMTGLLCSCEDDDDICRLLPPQTLTLPFAGSEDQLMANLQTSYEDMDYNQYRKLLHRDFEMYLLPSTQEAFPLVGPTLDLAEELLIHQRMFGGDPLVDSDGNVLPGISTISFQSFEKVVAWDVSPPTDIFPNTRFSLYDVTILWDRPGFSTWKVEGSVKFYVAGRDSLHDGVASTYWRMIGMQDLTLYSKTFEGNSWGSLKAHFWTEEK